MKKTKRLRSEQILTQAKRGTKVSLLKRDLTRHVNALHLTTAPRLSLPLFVPPFYVTSGRKFYRTSLFLRFYVRSSMKQHTVSVNIPRVPIKTRNIYEPSIYSSIKLSPYNPLIIIIYINVQNTHALVYRLFPNIVSPYHVQGITPPEAIIVACLSSLIQARLMCYFLSRRSLLYF